MGYREKQLLTFLQHKGPTTFLGLREQLGVGVQETWTIIDRLRDKELLFEDDEGRFMTDPRIGSRIHRWDLPIVKKRPSVIDTSPLSLDLGKSRDFQQKPSPPQRVTVPQGIGKSLRYRR